MGPVAAAAACSCSCSCSYCCAEECNCLCWAGGLDDGRQVEANNQTLSRLTGGAGSSCTFSSDGERRARGWNRNRTSRRFNSFGLPLTPQPRALARAALLLCAGSAAAGSPRYVPTRTRVRFPMDPAPRTRLLCTHHLPGAHPTTRPSILICTQTISCPDITFSRD